jgi:hypothetical protein
MTRTSQISGRTARTARNIRGSTHLRATAAANIRGTSIAKSVISSQSRSMPETRESDHS